MTISRRSLIRAGLSGAAVSAVSTSLLASGKNASGVPASATSVQLIRSATIRVSLGDAVFLVDPMLSAKGSWPGFTGTVNSEARNPLTALPMPASDVLKGVDAIVLTHTHEDHWDEEARRMIPKSMPVFVNDEKARKQVQASGFKNVTVLQPSTRFRNTVISPVLSQHGTDEMLETLDLGTTMGIFFERAGFRSVYVAGDTVWRHAVSEHIARFKPGIIVLNTGNALATAFPQSMIMGSQDFLRAYREAPDAAIVAVHMDAINHCVMHRADLRWYAKSQKLDASRALIPDDGEMLVFPAG